MMKRLIALLIALTAVLTLLSSCGDKIKPEDGRTVLTLSGEKVCYDYYRYVFLNSKKDMDGGEDTYWTENPEAEAELRESVMEILLHYRAIQLLAKDHGVKLSKEKREGIRADIERLQEQMGGREAYLKSLEGMHMTEYTLYYVQELMLLWNELYNYVTNEASGVIACSDDVLRADIPVNFRCVRFVFLKTDDTVAEDAQAIYDKAEAGEDFDQLIKDYGEDITMEKLVGDGYYYTLGEIDEDVQNAVETMAVGDIATVKVSYGYYVVQRLALQDDYIEENLEDFRTQYLARIFSEMLTAKADAIEVAYPDRAFYDSLTVDSIT